MEFHSVVVIGNDAIPIIERLAGAFRRGAFPRQVNRRMRSLSFVIFILTVLRSSDSTIAIPTTITRIKPHRPIAFYTLSIPREHKRSISVRATTRANTFDVTSCLPPVARANT